MIYIIITAAYILFVALVVFICHRRRMGRNWKIVITAILLLAPFWDMFMAKGIMWNYARRNAPLQQIIRTVDKPESVLWIDTVWPGFDEYGRHWMVKNYLDGDHLKTLALNGDDGKIYLYRATLADFVESEKIRPDHNRLTEIVEGLEAEARKIGRSGGDNRQLWRTVREEYYPQIKDLGYVELRNKEVDQIFARPEIYQNQQDLPAMNFQVDLQRIRLPVWQEAFVWCDEITIQDNMRNDVIAFSKRCLEYTPMVSPVMVGNWPFEGGRHVGDYWVYEFDNKVLFKFALVADECHHSSLYKR